jgi:hypothetical protein
MIVAPLASFHRLSGLNHSQITVVNASVFPKRGCKGTTFSQQRRTKREVFKFAMRVFNFFCAFLPAILLSSFFILHFL